ncbi:hypothetical protein [Streptomyces sudanensis]|uniref:hypothetical protein n=1 Tax=Streptomyces sudanensis TaxID=436397 RepID=UPI0020CF87F9|nr:hypothetical protein [Streptomyces sudanensis]MCP9958666.1 hypothetical protein [Streptomyces sudanensis]MCQ0000839.1 hypothetical protein [Streptomyces sudanensis]
MAWDEWEQAKREAATRMRLNQAAPGAGPSPGAGPDLVVHDKVLGGLGDLARELRDRAARDGDHARTATAEAASELTADGLDLGAAMRAVHDAWSTKLKTLKDACAHISNHLDYSRSVHAKDDQKIAASMPVSRIWDAIK